MNRFKIEIFSPNGIRELNPFGVDDLDITETIETETIFFREKKITGTLKFMGDDFHHLYEWEQSDKRCEKGTLIYTDYCGSGETEVFRHTISPIEINWNPDRCTCEAKVQFKFAYHYRYDELKDIEYNLFELVTNRIEWYLDVNPPSDPIFYTVPNAILVYETVAALVQRIYGGMQVKSTFFGWQEPQGPVIGHSDLLTKLIFAQNSDIYRRQLNIINPAPEAATIMKSTPQKIISSLCNCFNLKCVIEDGNIFRIEHVSYYDNVSGVVVDARAEKNGLLNAGRLKTYTYNDEGRFSTETFQAKNKGFYGNANGSPIEYDTCNSSISNVNRIEIDFTLDTARAVIELGGVDLNEGIFLGALDPATNIIIEIGPSHLYPNNLLWLSNLIYDYHRYDKSFKRAKINGEWEEMEQKRYRYQPSVKIASCCSDESIINGTAITDLGEGRIMKTSKTLGNSFIEADVYFHELSTIVIDGPTAVDDQYYTTTNDPINSLTMSLPSLIANDTGTGISVHPELKPTKAGGTVNIYSTGHFFYTPKTDFDGFDEFEYFVIDSNGLVATATAKIGIRIPVVYVYKKNDVVVDDGDMTVLDFSDIEYYRDNAMLYSYDTTGMNLKIKIEGKDYFLTIVEIYEFVAQGIREKMPDHNGETDIASPYTKVIVLDPNYSII